MTAVKSTHVVALTGGIAAGKTAVADRFAQLGVTVADADVAARNAVRAGSDGLAEIAAHFGNSVLTSGGELDRRRMRERVFANAQDRQRLEAIVHPRVRAELLQAVQSCAMPYCMLVVPLLTEFRADYAFVDRVLVIDVSSTTQRVRLMQRDGASEASVGAVLAAQAPRSERLAIADDVLDNDGVLSALEPAIARLHSRYLALAARG